MALRRRPCVQRRATADLDRKPQRVAALEAVDAQRWRARDRRAPSAGPSHLRRRKLLQVGPQQRAQVDRASARRPRLIASSPRRKRPRPKTRQVAVVRPAPTAVDCAVGTPPRARAQPRSLPTASLWPEQPHTLQRLADAGSGLGRRAQRLPTGRAGPGVMSHQASARRRARGHDRALTHELELGLAHGSAAVRGRARSARARRDQAPPPPRSRCDATRRAARPPLPYQLRQSGPGSSTVHAGRVRRSAHARCARASSAMRSKSRPSSSSARR